MNTFMINIELPKELTKEFISLIPKQRAKVDELMDEGKILHYSLALDRSKLWLTVAADNESKAMDIIVSFPLIRYMKPEIFALAFHNSVSTELPKLIMN
jgi:muconolactone delta-isomerase